MTANRRLRVGLVGAGLVGQAMHARHLWDERAQFDFVAVADASPAVREAVGARYGVPERHADVTGLLDLGLDAIVCAVPDPFHADVTLAALDAGLHVLCEKPLAMTVRECDAIVAARDRTGLVVQVAYMKRYDPAYLRLLDLAADAGPVRLVSVEVNDPDQWPFVDHLSIVAPDDVPIELRQDLRARSLALVAETGGFEPDAEAAKAFEGYTSAMVHDVAVLHGLCDRLGLPFPPALEHAAWWDAGRGVQASWRLAGDARASLTHLNLPGVNDYTERVTVFAADAVLELTFPSPYLHHLPTRLVVRRSGLGTALTAVEERVSYEEAFRNELRAFQAAVTEGAPVETPPEDARADLALLAEAFQCAGSTASRRLTPALGQA
jgi:predicted dehydrogenase